MKNLVIAFLTIVLFALTTMAQKDSLGSKMRATASNAISMSIPTSTAHFSCICYCGKSCGGDCIVNYGDCSAYDALGCGIACCDAAPNPGPNDCYGVRQ
jgi:hypothetical protein